MKQILGILIALGLALTLAVDILHSDSAGSVTHRAQMPGLASGASGGARASSPSAGSAGRAQTAAPDIAALRQEVANLREEVAALAAATRTRRADSFTQAIASLRQEVATLREDGPHEPPTPPPTREETARARQAQMQEVEANFWQESVDQKWSAGAAEAVTNALGSEDIGAQLPVRSLECRSHSCRVELANDGTSELATTLPVLLLRVTQTLPSVTTNEVDNPDGSRSTILYLAAGGHEAPRRDN